ncbi:MAG: conjugal transfer protein TraG N-terminal domain-containing protein [bacterium]
MNLELITYGNGEILQRVMTGVANIVTSPDYSVLAMTILGLATTLGIVGYHRDMAAYGIQAHSTWIIKGVTSLAIFWMLVGGSINVFIYDPLNNFNGVVDNVPMGIAMPLYMENQISESLSTLYSEWMAPSGYPSEFAYDNPSNSAGFYNPGMVSPLHAINVLTQAHFTDSYFYESLSDFTQNCLIPAMMLGVVDPNQFYIAGPGQAAPDDSIQDLLTADMANMPSGWTSVIYASGNPGGTTETCTNSWNTLNTDITNMTASNGSLAGQYGGYLNTATGSNQTALADQALLGNAAGYMLNISTTGQQMLGQAALMNSLSGPIAQFAQSTGTSSQAQAYALTQAFNQSENSWTTSAIMSAKMLPIFHLIMEMIVVAIFPLFFALAVVPTMTMKYLKLLFELLMWLALWSPIASVINFLVQQFMETKIFNNVSSTAMSGISGFNYANYSFIAHNSIVYTAVTGAIMWIIPLLSFGLVTGSAFVMSEAIGAVGSTARASAQSQGSSVGTSSGLQGIEGQGSNLAKGQALESQGKSWASADEKIAGMGGLDNLANASGFGQALRAEGLSKLANAKATSLESNVGNMAGLKSIAAQNGMSVSQFSEMMSQYQNASGAGTASEAFKQFGGAQGVEQFNSETAGMSFGQKQALLNFAGQMHMSAFQLGQRMAGGQGVKMNGMYAYGKDGKLHEIAKYGNTQVTFGANGQGLMAESTGIVDKNGKAYMATAKTSANGMDPNLSFSRTHDTTDSHFDMTKHGYENLTEHYNKAVNGTDTTNYLNRVKNDGGTSNNLHNNDYNVGMTPGALEGALAYKGKGAGQWLNPVQKNGTNFILSGKAGQGYKENLLHQSIESYAKVKNTSQSNSQDIKGQLEAFAQVQNKLYAGEGITFGVKEGDELQVNAGAKGSFTISYGEISGMKIESFKENAINSEAVQSAKTFTQLKSALNQSFNNSSPIENQLLNKVGEKLKGMGVNPLANMNSGASKEAEIKNLSNELTTGKITQAEYIKDAEKIGGGTHKW